MVRKMSDTCLAGHEVRDGVITYMTTAKISRMMHVV